MLKPSPSPPTTSVVIPGREAVTAPPGDDAPRRVRLAERAIPAFGLGRDRFELPKPLRVHLLVDRAVGGGIALLGVLDARREIRSLGAAWNAERRDSVLSADVEP